jgi:catechol 2,3-dioxygenase-like lactoylglutathione lyase family enzyme
MRYGRLGVLAITALACAFHSARAQTASINPGVTAIRYVTVLVKDYDTALAWYTHVLGFKKTEDRAFGPGRRWLVVAPEGNDQMGIVLEVPNADRSTADRIGKETNWVFEVVDCTQFYEALRVQGVHFIDPPKRQPWGTTQAVFEDPYGNIFVAESRTPAVPVSHLDSR